MLYNNKYYLTSTESITRPQTRTGFNTRTPATKISYMKSNVEISKTLIRNDGVLTNKRKFTRKIAAKFRAMLKLSLKEFRRSSLALLLHNTVPRITPLELTRYSCNLAVFRRGEGISAK